jgi:predicted glycosyltransferase
MEANKKNILVRLEESKAAYITECSRKKDGYLFLDSLVESAGDLANIVVICRYADQVKNVIERYGNKVSVIGSTIDGIAMINYCDLFIGAGGTMTAEACLMGKPTISIAPITFYVEKYLIRSGLLVKASKPIELLRLARKIVTDPTRHVVQKRNANIILGKMEDPIQIVMRYMFDHQ